MKIYSYEDFIQELLQAGFSMGGGTSDGIFALIDFGWDQRPDYDTPVRWHTGNLETDPWEWRMRVLREREDIAYGKVFFGKSGYITKEWYPYFLAVRRGDNELEEAYYDGTISAAAKRIYGAIGEAGALSVPEIKAVCGFTKEDKSDFDRGLTALQMKMYVTLCGGRQKKSARGEEYGWTATVLCKTEDFFGPEVWQQAAALSPQKAEEAITWKILQLNPAATAPKITRFIRG